MNRAWRGMHVRVCGSDHRIQRIPLSFPARLSYLRTTQRREPLDKLDSRTLRPPLTALRGTRGRPRCTSLFRREGCIFWIVPGHEQEKHDYIPSGPSSFVRRFCSNSRSASHVDAPPFIRRATVHLSPALLAAWRSCACGGPAVVCAARSSCAGNKE